MPSDARSFPQNSFSLWTSSRRMISLLIKSRDLKPLRKRTCDVALVFIENDRVKATVIFKMIIPYYNCLLLGHKYNEIELTEEDEELIKDYL